MWALYVKLFDEDQLLDTKISNISCKHEFADTFDELQDNAVQF